MKLFTTQEKIYPNYAPQHLSQNPHIYAYSNLNPKQNPLQSHADEQLWRLWRQKAKSQGWDDAERSEALR
jgi:hypothetical protein